MHARVTIDGAVVARQAAADRELERRMAAGGLSETRKAKSWRRIQAWRFWVGVLEPELRGFLEDLRARRLQVVSE